MRASNAPVILGTALTLTLLLGGCAAAANEATPSQTPVPTAEEPKSPAAADLPAGSLLTVEDRKALEDVGGRTGCRYRPVWRRCVNRGLRSRGLRGLSDRHSLAAVG